jgi:hypothetical protein
VADRAAFIFAAVVQGTLISEIQLHYGFLNQGVDLDQLPRSVNAEANELIVRFHGEPPVGLKKRSASPPGVVAG